MKKIALVAALAAISASAFAQSSVTLYGRINTSVESQKVGNKDRVAVLQNNSSRIGFKGMEDLGGGLKAGFVLEHGLNSDDGKQSQSAFWARQSEVNLSGSFGTVRLGNWTPGSYYATADYVSMHNHDTGTSSDALYAGPFMTTNKVGYVSPDINGLRLEAEVHAGEGAAGEKRGYDFAANYDQGPLHLGAGYSKQDQLQGGVFRDFNQFAVRGLYELGAFTVGGYYQRVERGTDKKQNVYRLSGMYVMGASEFHLNFGSATKTNLIPKQDQFTLGYNYNLSKRTKVYGFYSMVDAKNTANKAGDFSSLAAGIRHNF